MTARLAFVLVIVLAASVAGADEIEEAVKAARAGIDKGDASAAIPLLTKMVEKYPDDVRPHWWLANVLEKQGELRRAAEVIGEYVERDPDSQHAKDMLWGIGEVALDTDDPQITRWCAKVLMRAEPREKEHLYLAARASYRMGDRASVRLACREILSRWNSYASAYLLLARVLEEDGRSEEAGQVYRDLVKERPGDVEARIQLAYWLLRDARDFDAAEEEFTSALMQSEPGSSRQIRAQAGLDRVIEERGLIERLHAQRSRLLTIAMVVAGILASLVGVGVYLTRGRPAAA
jgi:tetratricopeptide (TPR) repeat protein